MITKATSLINQINEFVDELSNYNNPVLRDKVTQLKEISRMIQNLERTGVSIPNDLIILQKKLQSELKEFDKPEEIMFFIEKELSNVIQKIKHQRSPSLEVKGSRIYKERKRRDIPVTSHHELKPILITTLKECGGAADINTIQRRMEELLKNKFTPADLELLDDGVLRWQKNVQWLRYKLTLEGVIKNDSPRGIWELTEKYR